MWSKITKVINYWMGSCTLTVFDCKDNLNICQFSLKAICVPTLFQETALRTRVFLSLKLWLVHTVGRRTSVPRVYIRLYHVVLKYLILTSNKWRNIGIYGLLLTYSLRASNQMLQSQAGWHLVLRTHYFFNWKINKYDDW